MDDLDLRLGDIERRLGVLEAKAPKERKPVDTSNARPITLWEIDSVADGEMVSFTGRAVWHEFKGKKHSVLIKPLDAQQGDKKAGYFFQFWGSLPDWIDDKPVVDCWAQLKFNDYQGKTYKNFKIADWKIHSDEPDAYATPMPPPPRDVSPVAQVRTHIVSDEEAGVDPANIPF